MLLTSYTREFSRPDCRPEAQTIHCIAHLDQDVGCALPYLNAVLGGVVFIAEPPTVSFKVQGKLITVQAQKIAVNALADSAEADRILAWLQREINSAWEQRDEITPLYKATPQPQVFEILKLLPKSNCGKCGLAGCMVFAAQAAEGGRGVEHCPELGGEQRAKLAGYLGRFRFDF